MNRFRLSSMPLALAGVLIGCAAFRAGQPIEPEKAIELFNGKDLSNWTICLKDGKADPAATFKVEDGLIKCTGQPFGFIRTKGAYKNYVLTVEWRYVTDGNTGVFVHASGPDKIWPRTLECQGKHGGQGSFVAFADVTFKGMKGRGKPRIAPDNEKLIGEWNTYKIVCDGNAVRPYVNGKLMNEAIDCNISSGGICLQSEGGFWECRKVTLEPLRGMSK